jgi:hypothetical protein
MVCSHLVNRLLIGEGPSRPHVPTTLGGALRGGSYRGISNKIAKMKVASAIAEMLPMREMIESAFEG